MDLEDSSLNLFMEPKSVALIGVSRRTGAGSFNILENILNLGYSGELYPVNPKADRIIGRKAYDRVDEIEEEVDLAVISVPRDIVMDVVKQCSKKDIRSIIIVTQGFADGDSKGKELQEKLTRFAKEHEIRILGPNTLGVLNSYKNFSTSFVPWSEPLETSSISIICQTGYFFAGFPEFKPGKAIDLGNTCDVDHVDALRYLADDPETELIFLHVEGVRRGREFLDAAKGAADEKPVLVLKSGASEPARKAVKSHTGVMAGNMKIYEGIFKQAGVIRVRDCAELQSISKAFLSMPKLDGKGIAIVSYTGAAGVMAADACEEFGLEVPELSKDTIKRIRQLSPEWMEVGNPVDIWPAITEQGYENREDVHKAILRHVLKDENVSGILCVSFSSESIGYPDEVFDTASVFEVPREYNKPLAVWLYGSNLDGTRRKLMDMENVCVFSTLREAARTLSILYRYK